MTNSLSRCEWCGTNALYVKYHDEEWGVPVHDDRKHFEFLVLESAQAGLSWLTVLRKRENYRKAYDNFEPERVAEYDQKKVSELLANEGIVRNKLKITSSISNARHFLEIQKEFGSFDAYLWGFVGHKTIQNHFETLADLPARTEISDRVALDLKKRGFKFLGTKIIYAHMQAAGLVNDHITNCFRYSQLGGG